MAVSDISSLVPGDKVQSILTGYTYTVDNIDEAEGEIQMEGQPPVSIDALQEDIDEGRLRVLAAKSDSDSIP
jgi:hypothetical protein